ncbi:MAG: UDP-N-acetyl-alpha-D-glucosamine C6 dehydratase [Syntrophorhabdaceae bacterium PtaU1.Bin034]|nr:MAG: UDP-N-acetyl-alpha-D-glucosamine C6 dehydratase [Syntrophorhabdaceae bacterium PtaU1.Bin034]
MQSRAGSFFVRMSHGSPLKRFVFFFILDIITAILSLYLSFLVYFEVSHNINYYDLIWDAVPYFLVLKLSAFALFRIYRVAWRYFGIIDLFNLITALALANSVLLGLSLANVPPVLSDLLSPIVSFPKSVIFMDFTISLVLLSLVRISKRFFLEIVPEKRSRKRGKRSIIVGAGNTGEMIVRDMGKRGFSDYYPVGFLDDDDKKMGTYIHGVPVLGKLDKLRDVIVSRRAEAVLIVIPLLNHKRVRQLYDTAMELNVRTVKIIPRIYGINKPGVNLKSLEDLSIDDLIGRQAIKVDYQGISGFLKNKSILITGAGGSIGSEIAMQVASFGPARLILFDIDETELHNLGIKLSRLYPHLSEGGIVFVTGDVRDEGRVKEVLGEYLPRIVFHAAAYKHVPMMEYNPKEAVKVNIFGTYTLAKTCVEKGVEKFVMISTDKAVRPTSVMGATKRVAEHICSSFNESYPATAGSTQFVSVRFGNVLGSRGSVIPLFLDQLKHGGPLTVTHREMKRYFMTIPEAVSLVLQAGVIGKGGEVLVLDMGEPVYISEVAEQLIRMHGLEPGKDIDVQYTGLRPGEKLFEEILTAEEGTDASRHEKIFVARNVQKYSKTDVQKLLNDFDYLLRHTTIGDESQVRDLLKRYVVHYEEPKANGKPAAAASRAVVIN